ncbi:hypothetical protein ACFYVL_27730 [Streptomyces sp. NPDC004111]|uniref:hypothetical protein n=1 Tax=Streptomyces sp. NPDC004111 TaxID=3364690 RepID=UPI0036C112DB
MTEDELTALLAFARTRDSRVRRALADPQQSARTIAEWTDALADVPAMLPATGWDASHAVRRYYEQRTGDRSSQFRPVEPHDVLAAWAPHRAELMNRHTDPVPAADPDNPQAWREELLGTRAAVAHGHVPPAQYRAAIDRPGQRRALALVEDVGTMPRPYVPPAVADELAAQGFGTRRKAFPELEVGCPLHTCRAHPRRRCRRPSGTELREHTHDLRQRAYSEHLGHLMTQTPAARPVRARHTTGGQHR